MDYPQASIFFVTISSRIQAETCPSRRPKSSKELQVCLEKGVPLFQTTWACHCGDAPIIIYVYPQHFSKS